MADEILGFPGFCFQPARQQAALLPARRRAHRRGGRHRPLLQVPHGLRRLPGHGHPDAQHREQVRRGAGAQAARRGRRVVRRRHSARLLQAQARRRADQRLLRNPAARPLCGHERDLCGVSPGFRDSGHRVPALRAAQAPRPRRPRAGPAHPRRHHHGRRQERRCVPLAALHPGRRRRRRAGGGHLRPGAGRGGPGEKPGPAHQPSTGSRA